MAMENHAKLLKEILITPEEQVIIFLIKKINLNSLWGKEYIEVDLKITVLTPSLKAFVMDIECIFVMTCNTCDMSQKL